MRDGPVKPKNKDSEAVHQAIEMNSSTWRVSGKLWVYCD